MFRIEINSDHGSLKHLINCADQPAQNTGMKLSKANELRDTFDPSSPLSAQFYPQKQSPEESNLLFA